MQAQFLGTGGFHPNARRHTACLMIPELGLVFDAGTGAFRIPDRLQTRHLNLFLSHAHLDHICGLTYLLPMVLKHEVERCTLYGTAKTLDAVRQHLFAEAIFPIWPGFEQVVLSDQPIEIGEYQIRFWEQEHPGGSCGFRVDIDQHSLVYMTDTISRPAFVPLARGANVLVHECYFPDDLKDWANQTGHSHTTAVAEFAAQAGVQRLLLTHIDPQRPDDDPVNLAVARAIFPKTELAEDLMKFNW